MQIKVKAQKICAAEVIEAFDRFRLSTRLIPCDPDDRSTHSVHRQVRVGAGVRARMIGTIHRRSFRRDARED